MVRKIDNNIRSYFNVQPKESFMLYIPKDLEYPSVPQLAFPIVSIVFALVGVIGSIVSLAITSLGYLCFFMIFVILSIVCFVITLRNTKFKKKILSGDYSIASATITNKRITIESDDDGTSKNYIVFVNGISIETSLKVFNSFAVNDTVLLFVVDSTIVGAIKTNN